MDPLAIVSPHLDDAVLSAGQLMAGRADCVVITLFAGTPDDVPLTTYDRDCGFPNTRSAMGTRRREDTKATRLLHAHPVHLGHADGQYEQPADEGDLAAGLIEAVDRSGAEVVLGPLGLAHPDHHAARRAFADLLTHRPTLRGWLYEDQPARVLWPELVPDALGWWRGMGWTPELGFLGTGPLEVKVKAAQCYLSQLWALNMHAVLCPERHWELT